MKKKHMRTLNYWGTSFVVFSNIVLLPLLSCKWWLSDKQSGHNIHLQDSLTFLPPALSYLSCFPLQPLFCFLAWPLVLSRACYGSLGSVYLSPLPKSLTLFLLIAWLLSLWAYWHSFPFLPHSARDPVTSADTCAFVLLPHASNPTRPLYTARE